MTEARTCSSGGANAASCAPGSDAAGSVADVPPRVGDIRIQPLPARRPSGSKIQGRGASKAETGMVWAGHAVVVVQTAALRVGYIPA
jgi:hypothetical protein